MPTDTIIKAVVAGLLASVACGLGVLPLMIKGLDPKKHTGLGYAFAAGLMFAASVYNLILPGLDLDTSTGWQLSDVWPILIGILAGAGFLSISDRYLDHGAEHDLTTTQTQAKFSGWGGRTGLLVFLAMTVHSIPEGVAVGVGYTSDAVPSDVQTSLGPTLALAIAIHNIPEGLAVGIPLRSLPQPIAAVPAVALAWFFNPLMPALMGFAAGAMIFLVILELIPEALETESPQHIAWAFSGGFALMLLIQVVL